jgi:hypothetical protein
VRLGQEHIKTLSQKTKRKKKDSLIYWLYSYSYKIRSIFSFIPISRRFLVDLVISLKTQASWFYLFPVFKSVPIRESGCPYWLPSLHFIYAYKIYVFYIYIYIYIYGLGWLRLCSSPFYEFSWPEIILSFG